MKQEFVSLIDYYKDLFNQKSNELDKLRDISTLYDRFSTDPQFKYLDAFFQSSVLNENNLNGLIDTYFDVGYSKKIEDILQTL